MLHLTCRLIKNCNTVLIFSQRTWYIICSQLLLKLKMYSTKKGICTLHIARWSPVQGMQCWKKWMKCISSLYGCFILFFLEGVSFSFLLLHVNFLYLICWCFLRVKQHSGITCAICVKGKYIFTMSEILKLEQWYLLNVEIIFNES